MFFLRENPNREKTQGGGKFTINCKLQKLQGLNVRVFVLGFFGIAKKRYLSLEVEGTFILVLICVHGGG